MRRFAVQGLIALVSVAGLVGTLVIARAYIAQRSAERFLADFVHLNLGQSTQADAEHLARSHRRQLTIEDCQTGICTFSFQFDNASLSLFRLAPKTILWAGITTKDNAVASKEVILRSGEELAPFEARVHQRLDQPEPLKTPYHVSKRWSGGVPWKVTISLTPQATPDQTRRAYLLDLSCLRRIGGCMDARQLSPEIQWDRLDYGLSTSQTP